MATPAATEVKSLLPVMKSSRSFYRDLSPLIPWLERAISDEDVLLPNEVKKFNPLLFQPDDIWRIDSMTCGVAAPLP